MNCLLISADILIFSQYFSEKTKLDILYELSARADNSYEMPSLIFSEKYQEKIKMLSAKLVLAIYWLSYCFRVLFQL